MRDGILKASDVSLAQLGVVNWQQDPFSLYLRSGGFEMRVAQQPIRANTVPAPPLPCRQPLSSTARAPDGHSNNNRQRRFLSSGTHGTFIPLMYLAQTVPLCFEDPSLECRSPDALGRSPLTLSSDWSAHRCSVLRSLS